MRAKRRGISLLEVLISMFVLLIGLVGIMCLLPAGKYEISQGVKMDYATVVGRGAIRDLKIRGFLNPNTWRNTSGTAVFNGTIFTSTGGFVAIDPLGIFAISPFDAIFPSAATPVSLGRVYPLQVSSAAMADLVFRCASDVLLVDNQNKDLPPTQQMVPLVGTSLKRASVGNYSWFATISPNPSSLVVPQTDSVTVSVAVVYKRDLSVANAGESVVAATYANGEVNLTNPSRPVKPGQWIMLGGSYNIPNPAPPPPTITYTFASWYRIVAADVIDSGAQKVTVHGPDWNSNITNTQAWLIDNVIGVTETTARLELP